MVIKIIDCIERRTLRRLCRRNGLTDKRHTANLKTDLVDYYKDDLEALLKNLYKYEIAEICDLPDLEQYPRDQVREIALRYWRGELDKKEWIESQGSSVEDESQEDESQDDESQDDESQEDESQEDDEQEYDKKQEKLIRYELPLEFDQDAAGQKAYPYQQEIINTLGQRTQNNIIGERLLVRVATGGGKTRIANDWLWNKILNGKRVLWITMRWELLGQAASDLCRRYQGALRRIGRVGGQQRLPQLTENLKSDLVYTTIQTWNARKKFRYKKAKKFDYVVIDEVHWGEGQGMYKNLMQHYQDQVVFIGLSATPHKNSKFEPVCTDFDFHNLVEMIYLAKPIKEQIDTGIQWDAQRVAGDFSNNSLNELAKSYERNKIVVNTYQRNKEKYGKTLVFACNIAHAEVLTNLFQKGGFSAEVLHSGMPLSDQRQVLDNFRAAPSAYCSRTKILVNVAIMAYGVDIPDIETILMARPTASPILFSQMIGRGCRRTPKKSDFRIVDFVDNLLAHPEVLVTSFNFPEFGPFVDGPPTSPAPLPPHPKKHSYKFADILSYPGIHPYEALGALEFQPQQTFGIEFELTGEAFIDFEGEYFEQTPVWKDTSRQLLQELKNANLPVADNPLSYKDPQKDHSLWNVEPDGSCGWEVTSPILSGEGGFTEIAKGCRVLNECAEPLKLFVNPTTSTHVHLGWQNYNVSKLLCFMKVAAYYEPALMSIVSPSRVNNRYCKTIQGIMEKLLDLSTLDQWAEFYDEDNNEKIRYHSVNLTNLFNDGLGTVEIRLHNGTLEELKILAWISLWMRILNAVDRDVKPPSLERWDLVSDPLTTGPKGDIGDLANYINARAEMVSYFKQRREYVITHSYLNSEKYAKLVPSVSGAWDIKLPINRG